MIHSHPVLFIPLLQRCFHACFRTLHTYGHQSSDPIKRLYRRVEQTDPVQEVISPRIQQGFTPCERGLSDHHIKNDIPAPSGFRKIFLGIIDHIVCPERLDPIHIPGSANPGYLSSEGFRQLDRIGSHTSGGCSQQH